MNLAALLLTFKKKMPMCNPTLHQYYERISAIKTEASTHSAATLVEKPIHHTAFPCIAIDTDLHRSSSPPKQLFTTLLSTTIGGDRAPPQ
jgi:hypothetical protein